MAKKRETKIILAAILVYYAVYLLSVLYQSGFWADILSPAGALLAAFITFYAYRQTDRSSKYRTLPIVFWACLFWAAADILWAVDELSLFADPLRNIVTTLLYDGTTMLLAVAVAVYSIQKYKKWNSVQMLIDIGFVSFSCLYLIWILVFDKNPNNATLLLEKDWLAAASIILDCAVFTGIAIGHLSVRSGSIPVFIKVQSMSILVFVLTDLYYYYLYLNALYEPNTLIDAIYIASLLGIAGGYLIVLNKGVHSVEKINKDYSNVGYKHRGWLLFPMPLVVLLADGLTVDFFVFAGIILLQEALSSSLQVTIKNKQMLQLEKIMNGQLERKIAERTSELLEKNSMLDYLSNMDALTELHNRRHFLDTLELKIRNAKPDGSLALLLIDIDRFKTINDLYGHNTGDSILMVLSCRMREFDGQMHYMARTGGDEFIVLMDSPGSPGEAVSYAQKLIEHCTHNIRLGDYSFRLTLSIGIALYPKDASNAEILVKNADIAMYEAKKAGYNKTVIFSDMILHKIERQHEIELKLKNAVYDNEFLLFYQPFFTVENSRLIGMEALIRWRTPGNGLIPPAEFIPVAEKLDIIISIGNWVIEKAFAQIAEWNKRYGKNLKMGINVSPKQLDQTDFMQTLKDTMKTYGVHPGWIDVEITEGIAVNADVKISNLSRQFKDEGITISIDDFGTGYASFSNWNIFNFNRVKIAKQLIDTIAAEAFDKQIVKSIIALSRSLGIETIAEGVETQEQFEVLKKIGCGQVQGYLLGKPVPPETFEKLFLKVQACDPVEDV